MASDYSDDDDDRHRRRRSRRRSRSRSTSRDRNRSRKSKKSKVKRRSRSRSHSSERRSRRRSRSRSSEYSSKRRGHRKSRSRSRSRSKSRSKSDHDSRRSSRSRDSHKSKSSKTSADYLKEKAQSNAQLAEKKLQKALKAAITADEILRAQGIDDKDMVRTKTSQLTFEQQQKRASVINDIDSGDFVQETFKSSRSEIPLPSGSAVDASHTGAIFSSGPTATASRTPSAATATCSVPSASNSIMHPNLYIGVDEKMEKWKQKVIELRRRKLAADGTL